MDESLEVNLQPHTTKSKKPFKVIIFSLLGLLIIIGSVLGYLKYQQIQNEKQKKEYATVLAGTSIEMLGEFLISSMIVASYSDVWDRAIDNDVDFNEALANHKKNISEKGIIKDREKGRDSLRDKMKTLQNPPKEYMESYIVIKQMYGTYTKMAEQAISPSGSLIEFNRKTNDLASQYEQQQEELLITMPADVKKIKKEIEEKNKKEKSKDKL